MIPHQWCDNINNPPSESRGTTVRWYFFSRANVLIVLKRIVKQASYHAEKKDIRLIIVIDKKIAYRDI